MAIHTDFRKGQKLFIQLKGGGCLTDKFVESKSGVIVVEKEGRINLRDVRAVSIHR